MCSRKWWNVSFFFLFFPKRTWKIYYCWGEKRKKKTYISPFPATHTYIKLTLVSFVFLFFLHLSLRLNFCRNVPLQFLRSFLSSAEFQELHWFVWVTLSCMSCVELRELREWIFLVALFNCNSSNQEWMLWDCDKRLSEKAQSYCFVWINSSVWIDVKKCRRS